MRYLSIKDACRETGLSQYYLRTGCKNNSIHHIRSGIKILIDVDALGEALASENGYPERRNRGEKNERVFRDRRKTE